MKKILLVVAVAAVFAACESKKKEDKPVNPAPVENPVPVNPPVNGDTGRMNNDTGKTAAQKTSGEKGNGAVEPAK